MSVFKRFIGVQKKFRAESPLYRDSKTNFTNGEYWIIDLANTSPYSKYEPYNYAQIVNNTDQSLFLNLGNKIFTIPSGMVRAIDEESVPAFRNITVSNLSGSSATGKVELLFQKVISSRMILRQGLLK